MSWTQSTRYSKIAGEGLTKEVKMSQIEIHRQARSPVPAALRRIPTFFTSKKRYGVFMGSIFHLMAKYGASIRCKTGRLNMLQRAAFEGNHYVMGIIVQLAQTS